MARKSKQSYLNDYFQQQGITTAVDAKAEMTKLAEQAPAVSLQELGYNDIKADEITYAYFALKAGGLLPDDAPEVGKKITRNGNGEQTNEEVALPTEVETAEGKRIQNLIARQTQAAANMNVQIKNILISKLPIQMVATPNSKTFTITDTVKKIDKISILESDKANLVEGEDNLKNWQTLYDAVNNGTPIEANLESKSRPRAGVVLTIDGKVVTKTMDEFKDWLILEGPDEIKANPDAGIPGALIRSSKSNSSKDTRTKPEYKVFVSFTQMPKANKQAAETGLYQYLYKSTNTIGTAQRSVRSKVSYQVYRIDKATGKRKVSEASGEELKSKRTVAGSVPVYDVTPTPYLTDSFKKTAKVSKSQSNTTKNVLTARTLGVLKMLKQAEDSQAIAAGQISQSTLKTLDAIYGGKPVAADNAGSKVPPVDM